MQQRRRGLHPRLGLLASVVLVVGAWQRGITKPEHQRGSLGTARFSPGVPGRLRGAL